MFFQAIWSWQNGWHFHFYLRDFGSSTQKVDGFFDVEWMRSNHSRSTHWTETTDYRNGQTKFKYVKMELKIWKIKFLDPNQIQPIFAYLTHISQLHFPYYLVTSVNVHHIVAFYQYIFLYRCLATVKFKNGIKISINWIIWILNSLNPGFSSHFPCIFRIFSLIWILPFCPCLIILKLYIYTYCSNLSN